VPQGLGLPDATKRIAHGRLDHIENTQRSSAIGLDPVPQVLTELGLAEASCVRAV
jgi:hypothetical protein